MGFDAAADDDVVADAFSEAPPPAPPSVAVDPALVAREALVEAGRLVLFRFRSFRGKGKGVQRACERVRECVGDGGRRNEGDPRKKESKKTNNSLWLRPSGERDRLAEFQRGRGRGPLRRFFF